MWMWMSSSHQPSGVLDSGGRGVRTQGRGSRVTTTLDAVAAVPSAMSINKYNENDAIEHWTRETLHDKSPSKILMVAHDGGDGYG